LAGRTLDKLGLPPWDIFTARSMDEERSFCIAGDAAAALGPLARAAEVIE